MKLSGTKKILLLGLILIIIAGMVVVALKGFNVSLINEQHESIDLIIGKEINIYDINEICKNVFKDKKFVIRKVELFDDAVNINVESITDEEKQSLVEKVNEKYGTTFTTETIKVMTNSNIRIRDLVKPYITPILISTVCIIAYMIIRFRNTKVITLLGKIFVIILLTEAFVASIISIVRIPVTPVLINVMLALALLELVLYIDCKEKESREVNKSK